MKATVQENGADREIEIGEPICGVDFCDSCGDCLHCYPWHDHCIHWLVIYPGTESYEIHVARTKFDPRPDYEKPKPAPGVSP